MKKPFNTALFSCEEQYRLYHDIDIVDFVITEMTEYLDTHPYDREAIDYARHYIRLKNKLVKEYSAKYYPLTIDSIESCQDKWKWALSPLPWEGGCR